MNKKAVPTAAAVRELAILTGAVAIIAAAVYFFLVPSHASVSSISGLGIVLANFVPLPLSAITMILNVVLLVIGFLTCGREFGAKTVYTSILLPAFIGLFERLFPNLGSLTDSQELDVLCYILVVSVGLSILFNRNASSGGLDIVAKIMNKYLHMDLGKAMSLSGMCVALSAALVYDKKTVVLSVLGTYFNGLVLDTLSLTRTSSAASASSPGRKKNCAGSSLRTCTAARRCMNPTARTICRSAARSSRLWTRPNTRS